LPEHDQRKGHNGGGQHEGAAPGVFRYKPRQPLLEAGPCHHTVLQTEQGDQANVDGQCQCGMTALAGIDAVDGGVGRYQVEQERDQCNQPSSPGCS
jgi:hypothetical protein